jgi:PleD family two-component response regulator
MTNETPNTVLIVDDTPDNLSVLSECLEETGMEIMAALNGEQALSLVEVMRPDIILLDVMMPGMDGFETCERLKQNSETENIPVIFVTALMDTESKVKSFSAGAVDYICKPIQKAEVLARVYTHLSISEMRRTLSEQNKMLIAQNEQLEAFRCTAANELFTPLSMITNSAKHLKNNFQIMSPAETYRDVECIEESSNKMIQIILENLLNEQEN